MSTWYREGYTWQVQCYYADDVKPPKKPGDHAITTIHRTDFTKDMEVRAAESRKDIGRIVVTRLGEA